MKHVRSFRTVEGLQMSLLEPETLLEQLLWHHVVQMSVSSLARDGMCIEAAGGEVVTFYHDDETSTTYVPHFGWYGDAESGIGQWDGEIALIGEDGSAPFAIVWDRFNGVNLVGGLEAGKGTLEARLPAQHQKSV